MQVKDYVENEELKRKYVGGIFIGEWKWNAKKNEYVCAPKPVYKWEYEAKVLEVIEKKTLGGIMLGTNKKVDPEPYLLLVIKRKSREEEEWED